jgi:hypothetical protein
VAQGMFRLVHQAIQLGQFYMGGEELWIVRISFQYSFKAGDGVMRSRTLTQNVVRAIILD